jgi:hypothetical protein
MSTKVKLIIGVVATVVLIGGWVAAKSFTGNELGETCNGDGDCKGMEAVCLIGADNAKYCTVPCGESGECPAGYECTTVSAINVSGSGQMTSAGSEQLCSRPPAAAP